MNAGPRLGFIGIGLMGLPMCLRLLAAGHALTVWNRNPEKCLPLVAAGASHADSLVALTEASDVIMLCVADTAAVEAVVFAAEGVASAGSAGKIVVDFSSIEPVATRLFAARLHLVRDMHWVDAPVSGGVVGAEQGRLVASLRWSSRYAPCWRRWPCA